MFLQKKRSTVVWQYHGTILVWDGYNMILLYIKWYWMLLYSCTVPCYLQSTPKHFKEYHGTTRYSYSDLFELWHISTNGNMLYRDFIVNAFSLSQISWEQATQMNCIWVVIDMQLFKSCVRLPIDIAKKKDTLFLKNKTSTGVFSTVSIFHLSYKLMLSCTFSLTGQKR